MRLIAYGPFTDTALDWSRGGEGLHLVFGSNEAGKSSALRALRHLLYGIPERSADNFVHPYASLRVGACLRPAQGQVIECIRRKGRGNTLRTGDDASVLEESVLHRCLGGVDADLFGAMFAIDHADLVRGGREIIQGGGDVGRLVFSAGSGIVNLREVQNSLEAEADQLFRPAGQKPRLNEALARLSRYRRELQEAQLPGREWAGHDEALRTARSRKALIEDELRTHQRKLARLERIEQALPVLARRKELKNAWEAAAGAVLLPEDFADKRHGLLTRLGIAEREKRQARQTLATHGDAVSSLDIPSGLLESSELIEETHRELGSQRKAAKDRIGIEVRRDTLRGEAGELLKSLRDDTSLEQVEGLRMKKSEVVKVQELGARYERNITRIQDGRDRLPALAREIAEVQEALRGLSAPRPVEALRTVLAEDEQWGPLERQWRKEQTDLEVALQGVMLQKGGLRLGAVRLEELEALPVPYAEGIRLFEERFTAATQRLKELERETRKARSASDEARRRIETLRLEREVPSERELTQARGIRDEGWVLVARVLEQEPVCREKVDTYLDKTPGALSLADAFASHLRTADAIADRLYREAERVALKARLLAEEAAHGEGLEKLAKEREEAESDTQQAEADWRNLWEPVGVSPLSPRQMGPWAQDFRALVERLKEIRVRQARAATLKEDIDAYRSKLTRCLVGLGQPDSGDKEPVAILIKRARTLLEEQEDLEHRRLDLLRDKAQREKEMADAQARLEVSEGELKRWQEEWEAAVRPLGLDADVLPAQATAVMEELKSLFDKLKEAGVLQKRIEGIDRDTDEFSGKVSSLAEAVAPDLAGRPTDETVLELNNRLKRCRDAHSRKETLEKQTEKEKERLKLAEQAIVQVTAQLRRMCEEAGCQGVEELPEAEARSKKRRELERDLRDADEQLRRLSAGSTVEAFAEQAQGVDADAASGEMERLRERIDELGAEKSRLDQTIGSETSELARMDGSARAAELAEEIQTTLGGLENDVVHYARLKIAAKVLSRAIERYREKSQGPILKRAATLFSRITGGSFEGLRAEFDDSGHPVIVGVRPGGTIVPVEGMSDGTADQLYLALRLAGLERYLERSEPLPFIVDDILIRFDDHRAAATLEVLADLSRRTQVIFFTHHEHLVSLAERTVDPSVLVKSTIGA